MANARFSNILSNSITGFRGAVKSFL